MDTFWPWELSVHLLCNRIRISACVLWQWTHSVIGWRSPFRPISTFPIIMDDIRMSVVHKGVDSFGHSEINNWLLLVQLFKWYKSFSKSSKDKNVNFFRHNFERSYSNISTFNANTNIQWFHLWYKKKNISTFHILFYSPLVIKTAFETVFSIPRNWIQSKNLVNCFFDVSSNGKKSGQFNIPCKIK